VYDVLIDSVGKELAFSYLPAGRIALHLIYQILYMTAIKMQICDIIKLAIMRV
jgi:hypothetical protein